MNIFLSTDRSSYRRWVNVIPSAVLPGAAHFLSNRQRAAWLWFAGYVGYTVLKMLLECAPNSHLTLSPLLIAASNGLFLIFLCADAYRRPMPRFGASRWVSFLLAAAAILLLPALFVRQFFLQPFNLPTGGMQPTIMGRTKTAGGSEARGDSIMADKLSYRFRAPRRGEIIVFKSAGLAVPGIPQDSLRNQLYLKRVVGLPGERISIRPPFLRVNGTNVTAPEVFARISSRSNGYSGFICAGHLARESDEIVLGKDEYFVLGDNTTNSLDGRFFGPLKRRNIVGRAVWIYKPVERKGWLK